MNANMEPKNHKSNHYIPCVSVDANRLFCHPNKAQNYQMSYGSFVAITLSMPDCCEGTAYWTVADARKMRIHCRNKGIKLNIMDKTARTYFEQRLSNTGKQRNQKMAMDSPFFSYCGTCQTMPQGDVGCQPHSSYHIFM